MDEHDSGEDEEESDSEEGEDERILDPGATPLQAPTRESSASSSSESSDGGDDGDDAETPHMGMDVDIPQDEE